MSRAGRPPRSERSAGAGAVVAVDSAKVAEEIGNAALELAKRARDAGLTTIGYLLEIAGLDAGAEAATRRRPADRQGR
jgi:hypothetical protein